MITPLKKVRAFVQQTRFRLAVGTLTNELCLLSALFFILTSLLSMLFSTVPWILLPPVWDIIAILFVLTVLWKIADRLFLRPVKLVDVASQIEKQSEQKHLLLSIALEFGTSKEWNPFTQETFRRAADQITHLSFDSLFPPLSRLPKVIAGFSVALFLMTLVFVKPLLIGYWDLPLILLKKRIVQIVPGTTRVAAGSEITVRLIPEDNVFPSARLTLFTQGGSRKKTVLLKADSSGTFSHEIRKIKETVWYQFDFGGTLFSRESIVVVAPPVLLGLTVAVTPPEYTGLKSYLITNGTGNASVAAGTKLTISLLSKELSDASIILGNDTTAMEVNQDSASVSFSTTKNMEYTFTLKNMFGLRSDSLPVFTIDIIPDEKPWVQIVRPGYDKVVTPEQLETLWVEGADDFGIRTMTLRWFTSNKDAPVSMRRLPISQGQLSVKKEFVWNLQEQSLYPGDTLFYWVKVRDTYPYAVQEGTSDTFSFRLPGFEEIHRSIAENEAYATEKISEAKNRQESLLERLQSISNIPESDEKLTWEQRHIVDKLQQELRAQGDSLQNALKSLEESVEQLREEGAINDEISTKMDDIRKAFEDLIAQFGDSLLNFDQGTELSINDMKEAIQKAQELLPELNERLDNTLRFLELLKKDRELALFALQSEKLAQEQIDIIENRGDQRSLQNQKGLQQRIDSFAEAVDSTKFGSKPVQSALENVKKQNQKLQEQINSTKLPDEGAMVQMSSTLMDMAQKLKDSMSATKQKQMELLRKELLSMAGDLFSLSQWKEQITKESSYKTEQDIALSQQAFIESIRNVRVQLDTIKSLPPIIQQELRRDFDLLSQLSEQALQSIGNISTVHSMRSVGQGLENLQSAIVSIVESMSGQEQQGGSSGSGDLMSQLRGLSGKQGAINSAVSELLRSMMSGKSGSQSNRSGTDNGAGQEKARSDAQNAQRALADQLEKLAKKFQEESKESGEAMSRRLEELEKEARQLAEMLRNPPTQDIADRQNTLLSRMLQASLSMHKQDDGKEERQSRSAKNVFSNPSQKDSLRNLKNDADAYYTLRRKAFEGNFPQEYRAAIKNYFDSLGVLYLKK